MTHQWEKQIPEKTINNTEEMTALRKRGYREAALYQVVRSNSNRLIWIGYPNTAFSASSRMFDLDGEASTARTKQISAIIAPT
jgi:hypothetical protein